MFTRTSRAFVERRPKFVRVDRDDDIECACGEFFPRARRDQHGLDHCLSCSKEEPMLAQAPLHKQGYTLMRDRAQISENQYAAH